MNYRQLGSSGIAVSEIGFGAWGIGGATEGLTSYGKTDDRRSLAALRRALERGITFFDTSNVYGYGHSERLIGEAFRRDRDRVVIATKVGLSAWGQAPDFAPDSIIRSCDDSLSRLQTDRIDLLQLHNASPTAIASGEAIRTLERLVQQGKVRAWGLSMRSPEEAVEALQLANPTVVQVNLNMMDVRAVESGLLALAEKRGIGIIARTPLCFGFLSGAVRPDTQFPPGDHRHAWPPAQLAAWCVGADDLMATARASSDISKTQTALRFCLSFPAVSTVIPGMLTPDEVDENAAASDLGALPPEVMDSILAINRQRSFFVGFRARPEARA